VASLRTAPSLTLTHVREARERTANLVRRTPLLHSAALSKASGCEVWFKAENLQRTGSFKVRGAGNRIALLGEEERARGVVAASAGNHAQGVAVAASAARVEATIVMPTGAALAKVEATRSYGADVILFGNDYAEAAAYAQEIADRPSGPVVIHAFDDEAVIAGQGTLGLEILDDLPEADCVVIPVGGGGLAAGTALAIKSRRPQTRVYGVQARAAPAVVESIARGEKVTVAPRSTLADGIATSAPGELTLPLLKRYLDGVVSVDEEAISQAIVFLLERSKLVVEGAGAVGLAALMRGAIEAGGDTVVVLSGGNLDVNVLARIVEHGLTHAGRYLALRIGLDDRPGRLSELLQLIAGTQANVMNVEHRRAGVDLQVGRVEVELLLEIRSRSHGDEVVMALQSGGYSAADVDGRSFEPSSWRA
jgi:threonine dehydratase